MKKLTLLLLFISSQFAFSQTGEDVNTIYIECEGDSIAVDVSQFPNLPPEMLFEMFDCSDVDDWSWGDDSLDEDWNGPDWDDDFWDFDSTDVNNPWDEEDDDFWDFDSTDVNNPWGDENLVFEMVCSNGDVFEVSLSDMIDSSEDLIASLCGENGVDEDWNGPDWDDDFWDFDSTDVSNPWDEEELEFDCINSSPEAFELYLSCMNGDEGACEALEILCGDEEEEEEEEEEEWGEDIDALIEQLEIDCASQNDLGESCGILEMIYSCMNGSEDTCSYLEEFYEDFDFEEGEEEWGEDIDALIEQLENDCASQVDLGWSCGILEMINDCMSGNEEACEELEVLYEDFDFEEGEEEEEFDCINSNPNAYALYMSCMNGDEGACEALETLCGEEEEEEEEEWSWGEGENMGALFDAISSITVTENELVLVVEANDLIVSVFDESGFEFSPSLVDGYLVFGPFDINELYNIIIENMDGLEVLWGLFKPMASDVELFEEGVVSAIDNNFGDIFNLNQMVSIDEVHQDLKVYNTQYYDVMGRKVSNPSKGLYIEVQTTNIGEISTKRFILK